MYSISIYKLALYISFPIASDISQSSSSLLLSKLEYLIRSNRLNYIEMSCGISFSSLPLNLQLSKVGKLLGKLLFIRFPYWKPILRERLS